MNNVIDFTRRKLSCKRRTKARQPCAGVATIIRESAVEIRRKRLTGLDRVMFEEQLKNRLSIPGENDALTWPEFHEMWKVAVKADPDKHARYLTFRNKLRALIRARKGQK